MITARNILLTASILAFISVALGAFGAHSLEKTFSAKQLATFNTAVQYQFLHSIGLLIISLLLSKHTALFSLKLSAATMLLGIILFSGSLYLYLATSNTLFAMITPIGGLSFLLAWLSLAVAAKSTFGNA